MRRSDEAVPLDEAISDVTLIAPRLSDPFSLHGDYEAAAEIMARREEGLGRHGFRSLIPEME